MPEQTPTLRPSLQTTLEQRYSTQRAGGAFDAKNVRNQPIDFGLQNKQWEDPTGFSPERFSDSALDYAASIGVSVDKYKP
jgi:hypothetical protein